MNKGQSLVSPKRVTLILALVLLFLFIAGIVSNFVWDFQCHRGNLNAGLFVRLFDLDREGNIPTFYSSSALLLCSALLAIIAFAKKKEDAPYRLHWKALAVIFLFLSLDEASQLHEKMHLPLLYVWSRLIANIWVIFYAVFVVIFVLAYLRFLADLPRKTRNLFLVAGAIFVGGALGMELISGYQSSLWTPYIGQSVPLSHYCNINLNHQMLTTVE